MVSIGMNGDAKFNPDDERVKKTLQEFAQIHHEAVQIKANKMRERRRASEEEVENHLKSVIDENEAYTKKTRPLVVAAKVGIAGSVFAASVLSSLGIVKFLKGRRSNDN